MTQRINAQIVVVHKHYHQPHDSPWNSLCFNNIVVKIELEIRIQNKAEEETTQVIKKKH